jgi:hypothetical protein
MIDHTVLTDIDSYISDHILEVRGVSVMTDTDASELFESDLKNIREIVSTNPEHFSPELLFVLTDMESAEMNGAQFAFTDQGLFKLAGLLKTKRAIKVYVSLIQVLIARLPGKAYHILSSLHDKNS